MTEREEMEKLLRHARLTTTIELDKKINANAETALQKGLTMSGTLKLKERVLTMKLIKKVAVAAVIVLVFSALLVGLFTTGNAGSGVVFAEVVDQMQNVQSLSLDATLSRPGKPEQNFHNDISGERYRKTGSNGTIQIADGNQGKSISLNPTDKSAYIRTYKSEGNRPIEFILGFIDKLRKVKTEDLGRKELGGRTVVGFRAQMTDDIQREQQIDTWVDLESHYPVQIEILYKKHGVKLVMYNFTWNSRLDDSLFDMTPPPEYTVTDKTK